MATIDEVLETAHISVRTATLKVVVDNLKDYEVLFNPRCTQIEEDILMEDPEWKVEMKFPLFVMCVSPWFEDNTLSIWVEWPFDLTELSNWLKTFETK